MRQSWLNVADELNDPDSDMTLDDLNPTYVEEAEAWAQKSGFPWPPSVGDFDRWYAGEFREECPKCLAITPSGPICRRCGAELDGM